MWPYIRRVWSNAHFGSDCGEARSPEVPFEKRYCGAARGTFGLSLDHYMSELQDSDLLKATRRGDEQAFAELFGRYQRVIFRYAVHMCGQSAGDDVVQETFLAVLKSSLNFDPARGTVRGYLLGIARHCALKRIPTRRPVEDEEQAEEMAIAFSSATAFDECLREEIAVIVRAAIDALPIAYREAVVLCELEGIDYAAAATIMACPVGTVRSRLHRGKALLTKSLAKLRQFETIDRT